MNQRITALCLTAMLFGISGCATMSKDECLNADWNLIGFEDASQGFALDRIGQHRKACARVDVTPDLAKYEKGHQKGARVYCTVTRGYQEGQNGGNYQGICPKDLEAKFLQAYHDGQDLFEIKQRINTANSRINEYHNQIAQHKTDIETLEREIINYDSSSSERRRNLADIKDLQRDITDLEMNDAAAEQEVILLENDYQKLLRQHKAWGY